MWTRTFLWVGVLSSLVAGALAVGLLWLALFAVERAGGQVSQLLRDVGYLLRSWMIPGVPGAIIYAICWHVMVFRKRDYSLRNTWALIGASYLAAIIVGGIVMIIFVPIASLMNPDKPSIFGLSPAQGLIPLLALVLFFVPMYMVMAGVLLAIPFLLVAGPLALLQRMLLLRMFELKHPMP